MIERCLGIVLVKEDFDGVLLPLVCAGFIKLGIANLNQNIKMLIIPQCLGYSIGTLPCHLIAVDRHPRGIAPDSIYAAVNYRGSKFSS
ncbi:hypothetical protein D3C77_455580 [compost metagenome]